VSRKICQCTSKASDRNSECTTSAKIYEVAHRRAQLPAILRYRGLEGEAQKAAWMIDIETNLAALQQSLDQLDSSMAGLILNFSSEPTAKWK